MNAKEKEKVPVLDRLIPFSNRTICGLFVILVAVIISCSGGSKNGSSGGGGKPNPATDFSYDLTEDGQGILIKKYTGGPGKVVVPEKIEDISVLEIGEDAFNGETLTFSFDINSGSASTESESNERAGITSITIPNTVRKIGRSAFANTSITKFDMPDSVIELENGAFYGCENLVELKLSDNITLLETVGGSFNGALKSLKKANLPAKLEKIAGGQSNGFYGCGELAELIIPDSIHSIEFVDWRLSSSSGEYEWIKLRDDGLWYIFDGCGKLPLATRSKLKELGYKGEF
jgi:hypothetical protein